MDRVAERNGARLRSQSRLQAAVARVTVHGRDCVLARPTTFMNESGFAVRAVTDYYQADAASLLVAYDELDLPPGIARLKQGGGHGGHNGMRDIFRHLPDHGFMRLRIGIGHPGSKDAVTAYVLSRAGAEQERLIVGSIERAAQVLPILLAGDLAGAMTELHTIKDDGAGEHGL